jgi:hypothetical protein
MADTQQFGTDQVLWYNNGVWGQFGFAVPNFGDNSATINSTIAELVSLMGRNLQAIMLHTDASLRVPPSINTITRIHKLIIRARGILASRAVPPGTANMEATHATPAGQDFIIFPAPFFKVRNPHLRRYAEYILTCLSEMCQNTENIKSIEISTDFSGRVGQFLQRVYKEMATELLMIPAADASKADFTLTDAQLQAYNPALWFTSTEMIDTVPPLNQIPTEDDLAVLTDGIPASLLVNLQKYPSGGPAETNGTAGATTTSNAGTNSFAPAPSP